MIKKRAYIFVNIEIASWIIEPHQRYKIAEVIQQAITILKGNRVSTYSLTIYQTRLLQAVQHILYLTEISLEDMIEVMEKVTKEQDLHY